MSTVLHHAAFVCIAAGVLAAALTAVSLRDGRQAVRAALDLGLAAALLYLVASPGWTAIAVIALLVAVRQRACRSSGPDPEPR